ncbi:receptor-interacting serine/threonine-protein kinase 4-like [Ptychodera flava]|uniref:receptor-interacting serine/threonine-protein kinase 4-like n=1 Tax=Ptychodera flava TaxID=63121 RepID=UPI00396A1154
MEQLVEGVPKQMQTWLKERDPQNYKELVKLGETYKSEHSGAASDQTELKRGFKSFSNKNKQQKGEGKKSDNSSQSALDKPFDETSSDLSDISDDEESDDVTSKVSKNISTGLKFQQKYAEILRLDQDKLRELQSADPTLAKNGNTALHHAVYKSNKEVIEVLARKDVDVSMVNKHGETPLFSALKRRDIACSTLLLRKNSKVSCDVRDSSNLSQLLWVVTRHDEQMTGDIVECGVDINELTQDGIALLHHFANQGDEMAVGMLLKNRADVNVYSIDGGTPLLYAAKEDHGRVVHLLIENGAKFLHKHNQLRLK